MESIVALLIMLKIIVQAKLQSFSIKRREKYKGSGEFHQIKKY